ncbi:MAG: hypothetical protein CVU39_02310 [Chloroflexi bacterium HGW-Chloroflexi-10]|nr:MAG: hypothetical protein CVU39_02310 [Chloroflexi bacterium HGW-Chloroflexi-10]
MVANMAKGTKIYFASLCLCGSDQIGFIPVLTERCKDGIKYFILYAPLFRIYVPFLTIIITTYFPFTNLAKWPVYNTKIYQPGMFHGNSFLEKLKDIMPSKTVIGWHDFEKRTTSHPVAFKKGEFI